MDGDDAELMSELCMHVGDVIVFGQDFTPQRRCSQAQPARARTAP
jgi:hypothetical protein